MSWKRFVDAKNNLFKTDKVFDAKNNLFKVDKVFEWDDSAALKSKLKSLDGSTMIDDPTPRLPTIVES
ncbi:hypothetical protein Goklo_028841 [Gossypium klotzschianum]|uniref:Uncharacterized protein n=1 Tax=Gossypium klotzschianum TaxID=34286 RepID=A0A7J8U2K3_9ROSI|nr:hypothetical protein [Gossypium klotzschianum]